MVCLRDRVHNASIINACPPRCAAKYTGCKRVHAENDVIYFSRSKKMVMHKFRNCEIFTSQRTALLSRSRTHTARYTRIYIYICMYRRESKISHIYAVSPRIVKYRNQPQGIVQGTYICIFVRARCYIRNSTTLLIQFPEREPINC